MPPKDYKPLGETVLYSAEHPEWITIPSDPISSETITISKDMMINPSKEFSSFTVSIDEETITNILWETIRITAKKILTPKQIIHNKKDDSYIVIWKWGEKTIVRPMSGELSSPYAAFTAALAQIVLGSNSQVNKVVGMTIEPGKKGEKVLTLGEKVKLAKKEMKRIRHQEKK